MLYRDSTLAQEGIGWLNLLPANSTLRGEKKKNMVPVVREAGRASRIVRKGTENLVSIGVQISDRQAMESGCTA